MSRPIFTLLVINIFTGKQVATWTGYENEMPTAWEVWHKLCLAFPVALVHEEDGSLHNMMCRESR